MKTKWGNARINKNGYYHITSKKEGNCGKLLHRLIWEDFWRTEIPVGYVIHHRDHNPSNNCILNLQLMRHEDHVSLHNKGKFVSYETRRRMSENNCRYWENKKLPDEIKRKISEGNKGKNHSEESKKKMSEAKKGENHWNYGKYLSDETQLKMSMAQNTSGYFRVSKVKTKKVKQGFSWQYQYYENGNQKKISSVDIEKLEYKVKAKGLKWIKFEAEDDING